MATVLDLGAFNFLLYIFVFILIFAIVFAILNRIKIFGEGNLNAMIAFVIALIFVLMPRAVEFIRVVTPWYVVLMFVGFSILLVFILLGVSSEDLVSLAKNSTVYWTFLILGFIILIGGMVEVFGDLFDSSLEQGASDTIGGEIRRAVFHPRILAVVFTLLIASFAVKLLSTPAK